MLIRRFTSREWVWVSSDRFEGQQKGQHYMIYLISAVFENAQKFFLLFFIFLNLCLTKQQFLFVALFRFLLTLNIKKIIIINYNLNRPIKLRKQNTAILIVLREN